MNCITNHNILCNIALAALQSVEDPEIGLNIVDLGLIYQIDFDEENKKIFLSMTLTTQFCPMGESISHAAQQALEPVFPDYEIELQLTFSPPWNAERISEAGQEFLNQK